MKSARVRACLKQHRDQLGQGGHHRAVAQLVVGDLREVVEHVRELDQVRGDRRPHAGRHVEQGVERPGLRPRRRAVIHHDRDDHRERLRVRMLGVPVAPRSGPGSEAGGRPSGRPWAARSDARTGSRRAPRRRRATSPSTADRCAAPSGPRSTKLPGRSVSVCQSSASASSAGTTARSTPRACSGLPNTPLKSASCGLGIISEPA